MAESLIIGQPLAEELGLPEAKGAPVSAVFSLQRLLGFQEEVMRKVAARRKRAVRPAFLTPSGGRMYGVVRREGDE